MLDVDLLSVIRRWHAREHLSIREIAKRTGLSRTTIRKYLASGETQPKYPVRKGVSKLDAFAETLASWLKRTVNVALTKPLHRCEFLDETENIVLIGGPGTGKTHIATAIGVQAIVHHHRRVRFLSTIELVNALEQEKLNGRQGRLANHLIHADLVILDELGYLPFSQAGGALLFHLLSKLYEKTSVIITTNLGFAEWARVFGDAKLDHSTTGSTDSSLSHSGNRQRQLPFQKLNYPDQQGEENRGKNQKLSHNLAPRVGQFSMQNPGQISV